MSKDKLPISTEFGEARQIDWNAVLARIAERRKSAEEARRQRIIEGTEPNYRIVEFYREGK